MTNTTHLTNKELIDQLTLRDDLTDLEHDLLDRLISAEDALASYPEQAAVPSMELELGGAA